MNGIYQSVGENEGKKSIDFYSYFNKSGRVSKRKHITRDWDSTKNLARMPDGQVRSILGYAGESLVIGRALACGYNLFFKAWRDSKYDAVLDAAGQLFRIEIKQSGKGKTISATSGGRSGAQISRQARSRETVLSPTDSDFLIGIHTFSGKCWIVPTEVVHIRNRKSIPTPSLDEYAEKWRIFSDPPFGLSLADIHKGFCNRDLRELQTIGKKMGLSNPSSLNYKFSPRSRTVKLKDLHDWYVLEIWRSIFVKLSV